MVGIKTKQVFYAFAMILVLLVCIPLLAACGEEGSEKAEFNVAKNVKQNVDTGINYIAENLYNAESLGINTKYTVAEIKEIEGLSDFNYYVEVGSISNIESVNSITLGDVKFSKNETFNFSIGNNNFVLDKAYYVDNNKLYVAIPVIAFETVNNSSIKINEDAFNFNLDVKANSIAFTEVKFKDGATSEITPVEGKTDEWNVNIKEGNKWVEMYFDGATATSQIIYKSVYDNNAAPLSYGFTFTETLEGNPVAQYIVNYTGDPAKIKTEFNGSVNTYSAYIVGVGVETVKFNIKLDSTIINNAE